MINNLIAQMACEENFNSSSSTFRKTEHLNEQALLSAYSLASPSIKYVLIGQSDDVGGPLFIQPEDYRDFPDCWRFRETQFPALCKFTDFL